MNILITGAFGCLGSQIMGQLIKKGHHIKAFYLKNLKNKRLAQKWSSKINIFWGDVRNREDLEKALRNQDIVLHLAAFMPHQTKQNPTLIHSVNVGGISNIVQILKKQSQQTKVIFTSSITVYGNLNKNRILSTKDTPHPDPQDHYATQKLEAENILQSSQLTWSIFRLSFLADPQSIHFDPLMFDLPLKTDLEICTLHDTALALTQAVTNHKILGKILNLSGGKACRTTYGKYLENMFEILGLGKNFLPPEAFATEGICCGWMDTEESEALLHYQTQGLKEYFQAAQKQCKEKRLLFKIFKPLIHSYLLKKSPHLQY